MKFIFVFVALLAVALAAPQDVVHQEEVPEEFQYTYEANSANEQGQIEHDAGEGIAARGQYGYKALVVSGSYSFVGDDGQTYIVRYTADENGFPPQGAHLPVAPVA